MVDCEAEPKSWLKRHHENAIENRTFKKFFFFKENQPEYESVEMWMAVLLGVSA